MNKPLRLFSIALLGILLSIAFWHQPAQAQSAPPPYATIPCDTFKLSKSAPGAQEGKDVECGYLTVPENRTQPGARTIQLGVLIIKSTAARPAPDPLVLVQGGPGGSGIDLFAMLAAPSSKIGAPLRRQRDLIVLEQRGTQYSKPFLSCPELLDLTLKTLDQNLPPAESDKQQFAAYHACKSRLAGAGIDLPAYNSLENADDIADLARALGYSQINFYGVSYGTLLGQHLMRRHPEILRTVTLDGVVAMQINPNQEVPQTITRSYKTLFAACAADPQCNRAYPNLEKVFFDTVAALDQRPARLTLTDHETGKSYQAIFKGRDLMDVTTQLLYVTGAIPALPKLIYDASHRVFILPAQLIPLFLFDRTSADGMYLTVMCAEEFGFSPDQLDTKGVYPQVAEEERDTMALLRQVCADWNVPALPPAADQPVVSSIPTLLFSGNFDPVTPEAFAETASQTLSHHYAYTFPNNGHGAFLEGQCSTQILQDFLADPQSAPNAACIPARPDPAFFTPANRLMAPGATYFMRVTYAFLLAFTTGKDTSTAAWSLLPLALPAVTFLIVLPFPFFWFVSWLVHKLAKWPAEMRPLAHLGPWLIFFFAGVTGLFLILQIFQMGSSIVGATSDIQILVGVHRAFIWIYLLPWLAALVALVLAGLLVVAWRRGFWGAASRGYFTFTVAAALVFAGWLAWAGLLSVIFY